MRNLIMLGALLVLAALAACGRKNELASGAADPGLRGLLPGPATVLAQARRSASALDDLKVDGGQFLAAPRNLLADAGGLGRFTPASPAGGRAGLAYGVYQFDLASLDPGAGQLTALWSSYPAASALFIGLPDFAADRWRFFTVNSPLDPLPVSAIADVRAGDGRSLVAVVVAGTAPAELAGLSYGFAGAQALASLSTGAAGHLGAGQAAGSLQVNGNPAGIIVDGSDPLNVKLQFNRANNGLGTSFPPAAALLAGNLNPNQPLDRPGFAGVNNAPAVAYRSSSAGGVLFSQAADANGSNWKAAVTVDAGSPGAGATIALAQVASAPALVYDSDDAQAANRRLRYTRASDADGTIWSSNVVDLDHSYEQGVLLARPVLGIVAGRPAVAYYFYGAEVSPPETVSGIRYVYAQDAEGSAWEAPVDVVTVSSDAPASLSQLKLLDCGGRPGIGWFRTDSLDPALTRAEFAVGSTAAGGSFAVATVLDASVAGSGLRNAAFAQVELGAQGSWLVAVGERFVDHSRSTLGVYVTPSGADGAVDWTSDMRLLDTFDIFDADRLGSQVVRRASNGDYPGDFFVDCSVETPAGLGGELARLAVVLNSFYADLSAYDAFFGSFGYPAAAFGAAPVVQR